MVCQCLETHEEAWQTKAMQDGQVGCVQCASHELPVSWVIRNDAGHACMHGCRR